MSEYWVDPDGLTAVIQSMAASSTEQTAFTNNIATMNGARGAFSNDDDNQKFADTLDHIISQHSDIDAMFHNVLDRLTAVYNNYINSDTTAATTLTA
jgi:hypothetical protein